MNKYLLNKENILYRLSLFSLLVLFAGNFIYNSLIGLYGMPSFLGGYFTITSIFLTFLYIFVILSKNKLPKNSLTIIGFLVIWFIFVSAKYIFSDSDLNFDLYIWSVTQIIANLICFLIASNLKLNSNNVRIMIFTLILFSLVVLLNITDGRFNLRAQSDNERVATYQIFAVPIIIISFVTFVLLRSKFYKFLFFLISLVVLYYNGSRSEFVFYAVSIILLVIMVDIFKNRNIWSFIALSLAFSIATYIFLNSVELVSGNRITELFNISDSSSFIAREQLNELAIKTIINKPILGDYGYYLLTYGMGSYAHNILSAWADFGLIGFLLFFGISSYFFIFSFYKLSKSKVPSYSIQLLFLFSVSLFIGYLFAKDYSYMFLGFTLGLYINVTQSSQEVKT